MIEINDNTESSQDPPATEEETYEADFKKEKPARRSKEPNASKAQEGNAKDPCEGTEKIIKETLDILKTQRERIDTQKSFLSQMTFILNRIREGIESYQTVTEKINTFLVNNDKSSAGIYSAYCRWLPEYGDYLEVMTDSKEPIMVQGMSAPVAQKELKITVDKVTNVFYASGMAVKSHRMLCKAVNNSMQLRRNFYDDQSPPFVEWFHLLNTEASNQTRLGEKLFQISSYIDYLKAEDTTITPELDLSKIASGKIL